jgi:plasmid stability protein
MMANLTIAVEDDLLRRARIRAVSEGTSVNAVLRDRLEEYVGERDTQRQAVAEILAAARKSKLRLGGRRASRAELHERR